MSVTHMSVSRGLASRRNFMRGMLGGAAISVALPFLDCFLNANGTALANGAPLPTRFGTWFWGCGLTPGRWEPKTEGANYMMPDELAMLAPYRDQFSIFTGFKTFLDGNGAAAPYIGPARHHHRYDRQGKRPVDRRADRRRDRLNDALPLARSVADGQSQQYDQPAQQQHHQPGRRIAGGALCPSIRAGFSRIPTPPSSRQTRG